VLTLTATFVEPIEGNPADLLARAQAGDAEAFCEWCRPFETRLVRQAMALCGEGAMAEDLAQDTFVEAWRCLSRYNGRCRFFTWLCAILLNRHRNGLRKKRPVPISSLSLEFQAGVRRSLDQIIDSIRPPDLAAEQMERDALLHQSLHQLPPKHREVIHLRFFADDSLAGIAVALNCSIGTVKSRLFHALKKLPAIHGPAAGPTNRNESKLEP
jgi:RNA polymerase sigma-70 factor (ECF subfamily)